jgi:hypothetical protein
MTLACKGYHHHFPGLQLVQSDQVSGEQERAQPTAPSQPGWLIDHIEVGPAVGADGTSLARVRGAGADGRVASTGWPPHLPALGDMAPGYERAHAAAILTVIIQSRGARHVHEGVLVG